MTSSPSPARPAMLAASIEASARQVLESSDLPGLFPKGVRVYIADVGVETDDRLVAAARRLHDLGYVPVPHIAARRLTTRAVLEDRIRAMAGEAGVRDVLVVGGGPDRPEGEFGSTLEVLETGLLDRHGIADVAVAGHPEGSPVFSEQVALEALRLKQAFGERTGARMRIVTQFGFDGLKFAGWAESLRGQGIDLPVHLGVAGPARITTLLKYAALCGVGNSLAYLKRNARSLTTLATGHSPEAVVGPIEDHVLSTPGSAIEQLHVFPFGGLKAAAGWLRERGTWKDGAPAAGLRDDTRPVTPVLPAR